MRNPKFEEVAKIIKDARKESGLTQAGFAQKVGISISNLGNYEAAQCPPPADVFLKILRWNVIPEKMP